VRARVALINSVRFSLKSLGYAVSHPSSERFQNLFDSLTVLMVVFALRFSLRHPKGLPLVAFKFSDAILPEGPEIEKLRGVSRKEFLQAALPIVAARRDNPSKIEA
jgi:hypothetical protein